MVRNLLSSYLRHRTAGQAVKDATADAAKHKVIMSTDYSGTGTAEVASCMIDEAFVSFCLTEKGASGLPPPPPIFQHYRACDIDPTCRRTLKGQAKHVMVNIMDRVEGVDDQYVKKELEHSASLLDADRKKLAAEGSSKGELARCSRQHGRRFADMVWQHVGQSKAQPRAPCRSCGQDCLVHPPPADRDSSTYVVVMGNTCLPWSAMGSRKGWLHDATLPYMVALRDAVLGGAVVIIKECSPDFDWEWSACVLNNLYCVMSVVFSPLHLGLPVRRSRRYTICIRRDSITFSIPWDFASLSNFAWRTPCVSARMFFRAPTVLVKRAMEEFAVKAGLPNNLAAEHYMRSGNRRRLEAHRDSGKLRKLQFMCINVRQSASFVQYDSMFPAITVSSTLLWGWDLHGSAVNGGINRPMLGYEMFGAHGYPVLMPESHAYTKAALPRFLDFGNVLYGSKYSLSEADMKATVGNGMHVAAVGLAMLHSLVAVSKAYEAQPLSLYKFRCLAYSTLFTNIEKPLPRGESFKRPAACVYGAAASAFNVDAVPRATTKVAKTNVMKRPASSTAPKKLRQVAVAKPVRAKKGKGKSRKPERKQRKT